MRIVSTLRAAKTNWLLLAILALGLGLRLWSIDFGLPYTYAPDETWHLSVPLRMLKTGDPNPHWLGYPHLAFYLNALAFLLYFLVGKALGFFGSLADLAYADSLAVGVGKLPIPSEFLLSRGLTALVGTLAILVVYLIGRRRGKAAGLVAALLFAVSPANVANSHLIRLDTFAVLFVLLAFLWIDQAFAEPSLRHYILAGIGVGLAFSGKYNAGVIALALVVAHLLNYGWRGFLRKEIYIAGVASFVTFAAANPFSVLDLPGFFQGLTMAQSAQTTHAGSEGDTVRWYASFLWSSEGLLALLGLAGAARALLSRSKRDLVLISFPLVYYVFINLFGVHNDRTVMVVIPFLDLLAAFLLVDLYHRLRQMPGFPMRLAPSAFALAIVITVWLPLLNSVRADLELSKTDSRETARVWIERNLPPGSRVALESYSPYVDQDRFFVQGFEGMIDHAPDWYAQNGFEYLVLSYGAYGRFYENASRYPEPRDRYDAFFSRFPELVRFNDGGYEVRILKTNVTDLPSRRLSARWGVFGPWLEFIGYDWHDPTLDLYWRILSPRKESFTLTTRLLDREGREIATFSANPFTTPLAAATGIVKTPWAIVPPPDARPGVYRLELDLDAEGVGRVSVLSRDYQPISDKYFIDHLKFALGEPSAAEWESARPANATFGGIIALPKYALDANSLHPGDLLTLTLFWQPKAPVDKDYTVFVHFLDAQGNVRAQLDAMPRAGAYPTTLWDAGELVRDYLTLVLPADLTSGEYSIELGLYEYPSLARLDVADANGKPLGDHLILAGVTVR
jgi:4-amino-4-deoxy-L-arabinose transferase-like glycosyltransferase